MKAILVLCLTLAASAAVAETPVTPAGQLQTSAPSALSNLHTALEVRPSFKVDGRRVHSEDEIDLWYQFSPTRRLQLIQFFSTNLFDTAGRDSGVGLALDPFWVMFRMKDVWTNSGAGLSLGYEPAAILPTDASGRNAGKLVELRNTLRLKKTFNPTFYTELREAPVLFAYSQPGSVKADGATANPIFQNRLYLILGANLTDKLSFELPFWFLNTRNRSYTAAASNNDSWSHTLMIWPELDYTVNQNLLLGVAYYSDNLVKSDLSGFQVSDGLSKGAAQLVVRASL